MARAAGQDTGRGAADWSALLVDGEGRLLQCVCNGLQRNVRDMMSLRATCTELRHATYHIHTPVGVAGLDEVVGRSNIGVHCHNVVFRGLGHSPS